MVSDTTVLRMLQVLGYRLMKTFKTKEARQHPDRDAQFRHINDTAAQFLATGDPVISVDTKKKELVGEYAQGGREWQPEGQPVRVNGTTSRPACPRRSRTACSTWPPPRGSSASASTTTPRRSRSTPSVGRPVRTLRG